MTTQSSTTKTVAIVTGSLLAFVGVSLGIGGGAAIWAHNTQRDSAGYFATSAEPLDTPSFALTSGEIDLGVDASDYRWIPGDGAATVRLQATPNNDRPVFVGIARSADVEAYLAGSAHAEVTDFDVDPFRAEIRESGGALRPGRPADQGFWAASANGSGTQTVTWPAQSGSWTVVLMNADGSPGVAVDVAVGAKTGVLLPIGLGLVVFALVVLVGGVALIVAGSGGRQNRARPSFNPTGPTAGTGRPGADAELPAEVGTSARR